MTTKTPIGKVNGALQEHLSSGAKQGCKLQKAGSNLCLLYTICHHTLVISNTQQFAPFKQLSSGVEEGSEYIYIQITGQGTPECQKQADTSAR